MAQSAFFSRHEPHQTVDVSKERMSLVLNLSAQESRQRSFIHGGRRLSRPERPHRLSAACGAPAQGFPADEFQPD